MSYNVVFESTKESKGHYLTRRKWHYKNEADFKAKYQPRYEEIVLEQGITEDRARDLVNSVPDVCRLTSVIEKMFEEISTDLPSESQINQYIEMGCKVINWSRDYRQEHNLPEPPAPATLFGHFLDLTEAGTTKAQLMSRVISKCDPHTGRFLH